MTAFEAVKILEETTNASYLANSVFLFIAACLVFLMQAGFALLETGYTRSKNSANIWLKNLMDFSVGVVAYLLVGFAFQYGDDFAGIIGITGFINPFATEMGIWQTCVDLQLNPYVFFFFQLTFCGATATIISGAVAERFKFHSYLLVSLAMTSFIYPIASHWIWGGGWLSSLGFVDFAGTLAVHGIGGIAALVCAKFVGPRVGKYNPDGSSNNIRGHNFSFAGLGAILLWLGWYGFNPGSALGFSNDAMYSAVTTSIAGGFGALGGLLMSWMIGKKPSVECTFNGCLAGMVAICSTTNYIDIYTSMLIGFIAGGIVMWSTNFVDTKLHIDDACGAGSLHFVSGIPGVLVAGMIGMNASMGQLGVQALGIVAVGAFVFVSVSLVCLLLKSTVGLRVDEQEEIEGMDIAEHEIHAYDYLTTDTMKA